MLFSDVAPDEKATAVLIRKASQNYVYPIRPIPNEVEADRWLAANAANLELLADATALSRCAFDSPGTRVKDHHVDRSELVALLIGQAN